MVENKKGKLFQVSLSYTSLTGSSLVQEPKFWGNLFWRMSLWAMVEICVYACHDDDATPELACAP